MKRRAPAMDWTICLTCCALVATLRTGFARIKYVNRDAFYR